MDLNGNVIGINTAINAAGQNIGFAIPIDVARRILPQLRESGRVVRGYLGVSINNLNRTEAEAFGLSGTDGALIEQVVPGHAAEKAGMLHGDIIISVDGQSISDTRELIDTISAMPPGTKVGLGVIRDGKSRDITVTLEERDLQESTADPSRETGDEGDVFERVGVTVTELGPRARQSFRIGSEIEGVVVTRVRPLSPAGEEGVQPGFVITEANGAAVSSPAELRAATEKVEISVSPYPQHFTLAWVCRDCSAAASNSSCVAGSPLVSVNPASATGMPMKRSASLAPSTEALIGLLVLAGQPSLMRTSRNGNFSSIAALNAARTASIDAVGR